MTTRPGATDDTAACIVRIVATFHEGHRRDLPALAALARALPPSPAVRALGDALDGFARALEDHMFKEEMRLFPMMEQGGHTLVAQLIEDMVREHRRHEDAVAVLHALRAALPPGSAAAAAAFDAAFARLLEDLDAHVRTEEEALFPRFLAPGG